MISKTNTRVKIFGFSKIAAIYLTFIIAVVFLLPIITFAQVDLNQAKDVADNAGLGTISGTEAIGRIIKIALGFLGLIALVIVMIAGFKWMTSNGNEEKIKNAKKMLLNGIIGMIIILFSYVIVNFIIKTAQEGTGIFGGNGNNSTGNLGGFGAGALGGGVIEYHYPERDANNVARNSMIMITFKVPVKNSSVIGGAFSGSECNEYIASGASCGKLSSHISITDNGDSRAQDSFIVVLSADGKNVLIDPISHLGSPDKNTNTIVHLTGNMQSADDKDLFAGLQNGYSWTFEVSTFLDVTPPKVNFVWPKDGTFYRNAIVQITFSESINIMSISSSTVNIKIAEVPVLGALKISNGYKTVEFLSSASCGQEAINSCGEQVFCLPANSNFSGIAKSGSGANFLTAINDASGNFLDGDDEDDLPGDDFDWVFSTNNELELTPPEVSSISPNNNSSNNSIKTDVSATFNELISPSSLSSDNFYIYKFSSDTPCNIDAPGGNKADITDISCFPNYTVSGNRATTSIKIYSPFLQASSTMYRPRLTSSIKDSYGNCFYDALGIGRETSSSPRQR